MPPAYELAPPFSEKSRLGLGNQDARPLWIRCTAYALRAGVSGGARACVLNRKYLRCWVRADVRSPILLFRCIHWRFTGFRVFFKALSISNPLFRSRCFFKASVFRTLAFGCRPIFDLSLACFSGHLSDTSVLDSFDASASDSPKFFYLAAPLLAQVHLVGIFARLEDMFCAYQEWILIDSTEVDLRWTQA